MNRRAAWVSRAISRWRELADGRRTLVACSGGADSTALLLVLRSASARLAVGHVAHDLRPDLEVQADLKAARDAAGACGVPFLSEHVRVPPGNAEGEARSVRYAALARLARASGCDFVASAHHAGDQFEGVVMALVRGAGVRGLGAAREAREITCPATSAAATLIRPLLHAEPAELRATCVACGLHWSEDATNRDEERFRAGLRHGPLAEIERLRPGAAARAARTAEILRDAAGLVEERALDVFEGSLRWNRASLRPERQIVLATGLRAAFAQVTGGVALDRLSSDMLEEVCRAIRSASGEEKRFDWPAGVRVTVGRSCVEIERAGA